MNMIIKKRKRFTMDVIDKVTLEVMYVDKLMRVQDIADAYGKTRQRIWQLLKQYGLHNGSRVVRECMNPECGKSFNVVRSKVRAGGGSYCSDKCHYEHKGSLGYEPSRQGQRIGRQMVEKYLGFKLPVGFIVHHENGNQGRNDLDNLWVFPSQSEHLKYHHAKRRGEGVLPYKELWELPGKIDEWLTL